MIYISSANLDKTKITDTISILYKNGFRNIELSGGCRYYRGLERDLRGLKLRHNLHYLCHNHFAMPGKPLVLNLASLDDEMYQKTLGHLRKLINLSKKLGLRRFGFHAGFFLDIAVDEIGRGLKSRSLFDRRKSIKRFCQGFKILKRAAGSLELYIENNVISYKNLKTFKGRNPFMLTNYQEYRDLKELIDYKLLLDVGHLKVSCASLGLDFQDQLVKLLEVSDYLHFNENNALSDEHRVLSSSGNLFRILKKYKLKEKIIVLETRGTMEDIKRSYILIRGLLK